MAFWKKSEDPWDIDPEKRRPAPQPDTEDRDPDTGLLEDLRTWNENRKAEKALRETPPAPIPCPWCGGEMEPGYLVGGRDAVRLVRRRPGGLRLMDPEDTLYLQGDGTFWCDYKIAWTCKACRKLVLDLPEEANEDAPQAAYEEELRRYADQANTREEED
ncbi:PF20097 family protein [Dysosmobacter sp.]|uniref:PF20097 family protein n=1 Tax=Dysosmobacter sp. TaxID=2591382 RepID=UPI002A92B4D9|nr:PF20097 family protein [Dysosmobacter sp.]MCI6054600.1 PF20097 family protein [Dysosmobacter sp.]MDY5510459.1 PF20097 family protein [Dysosmobacter sp.]